MRLGTCEKESRERCRILKFSNFYRPVSVAVSKSQAVWEVRGSIPGSVMSERVSPTARHRNVVFSDFEGLLPRNYAAFELKFKRNGFR